MTSWSSVHESMNHCQLFLSCVCVCVCVCFSVFLSTPPIKNIRNRLKYPFMLSLVHMKLSLSLSFYSRAQQRNLIQTNINRNTTFIMEVKVGKS